MIKRYLTSALENDLYQGKVIVLIGPRQVGKTTLVADILSNRNHLHLNADDPTVRDMLDNPNTALLRQMIGKFKTVFIDEAQRVPNMGITAKIIADQFKFTQLILSGSSAFEINEEFNEPLTGRKWSFDMWPVTWCEWEEHIGFVKAEMDLDNRLIFGFYPEILTTDDPKKHLRELVNSYLYKDILAFEGLQKPEALNNLVRALAYQIGHEVEYNELAQLVQLDPKTVKDYIDILEKAFVIFRLPSFSGNLRNEIKSRRKIFFYDNGVRNAVIGAFEPLSIRRDVGPLWENFLIAERKKQLSYYKSYAKSFFWRTKQQQEIDYVETDNEKITAYEFKWNPDKKIKFSKTFTNHYDAQTIGIHRKNFRSFVSLKDGDES